MRSGLVRQELVDALATATDRALSEEATDFPIGDDQHGRLLFAPMYGGPFLELLGDDAVLGPIEELIGTDVILYTMTTSVLSPGSAGVVHDHHVDLAADRPHGLALAAMVLLDDFTAESGATEFLAGSHRPGDQGEPVLVLGRPGDVCFFDPRTRHRGTLNRTAAARRAVLLQMVQPWMKQRFDVPAMLAGLPTEGLEPVVRRRLGLDAVPPASRQEFLQRRSSRPWS